MSLFFVFHHADAAKDLANHSLISGITLITGVSYG